MKLNFVTLTNGKQVHYRRTGDGPPLIMLHASPQCSEALIPAMTYFSPVCTCIAFDTPGYGYSDVLSIPVPTIGDYTDALMDAVTQLGIDEFIVYGVATGSQIAIEMAKRYPERVKFLMMDANGHISDEERERILVDYLPSVKPIRGGGHLLTYWEMCRSLFVAFPWTSGKLEESFPMPLPPPEVIQNILLRYLKTGENYSLAYRTAFEIEKRDHLDGLSVPSIMTRWEDSPVLSIADDLIELGLPECVRVLYAGKGVDARYSLQVEALQEELSRLDLNSLPSAPKQLPASEKLTSKYYEIKSGQIHAKFCPHGTGRPLVCLHDVFRSTKQLEAFAQDLVGSRPLYLIDLSYRGLSSHLSEGNDIRIAELAEPIAQVLRDEGLDDCDIVGVGLGAAIAAAISQTIPFHHIHIVDPVTFTGQEQAEYLKSGIVDLTPKLDGTHLVRAWNLVRNKELYDPWYDARGTARLNRDADLNPASLHDKTYDLLKVGENYPALEKTYISIDWQEICENLTAPHTVWSTLAEIKF